MPLRNVQVDVEDANFQAALNRATREGKPIGQVIGEFLKQYADGASTGAPTTYTVKAGDTLGTIATKVYADAHKYPIIQRANNIADPSRIWVGQVLIIPPIAGVAPAPSAPTVISPPTPTFTPVSTAPISTPPTPPAPVFTPSVPVFTPPVTSMPAPVVTSPAPVAPVAPTPTPVGASPAQPSIRWVGSPNFNHRANPNDITAITMHSTANSSLQGVIDWFNNPNAKVSAHYTIGKDGTIVQHVRDTDRAWHAGQSVWKGRSACNDYCIGIEMVNLNDGADPYPEEQHKSSVALCAYLCYKYNINPNDIMAHYDIALPPGRKTDPRNYDMNRLRREVAQILGR
jgi:LysM repeat protein